MQKRNKTAETYGAEHECEFTSTDRSVFSEEYLERAFCGKIPIFDELSRTDLQFVRHRPVYYIGLDLASMGDYAAFVMVEYRVTPTGTRDPATYQFLYRRQLRVVHVERFRKRRPIRRSCGGWLGCAGIPIWRGIRSWWWSIPVRERRWSICCVKSGCR